MVGVEQRDRRRLVAGHLAVGVVADERAVGDRAVEARPRPRPSARRAARRPPRRGSCSAANACCSPRGVGDEVARGRARRARPAAPARSRRTRTASTMREEQRDQRRRAPAASAAMPAGSRQVVHERREATSARGGSAPRLKSDVVRRLCCCRSSVSPGTGATVDLDRRPRRRAAAGWSSGERRPSAVCALGATASTVSVERDRLAAPPCDLQRDLDVELVVLALVGELDRRTRVVGA